MRTLVALTPLFLACGSRTGLASSAAAISDAAAPPPSIGCPGKTNVQPGSPWPAPRRCPTNAANSPVTFSTAPHVQWSVRLPDLYGPSVYTRTTANAVAADGTIYLGADGLLALDASGQTLWQVLQGTSVNALFVGPDGTIYTASGDPVAPRSGVVTAVLPSGTPAWTFRPSCGIATNVVPGTSGEVYVLVDADPTTPSSCTGLQGITCLHSDGSVAWSWSLPELARLGGAAAVGLDGTLYVIMNDVGAQPSSTLVAMSPTGTPRWRLPVSLPPVSRPQQLLGPDGTLYASGVGAEGTAAVSPQGQLLWSQGITVTAIGADGTVYGVDYGGVFAMAGDASYLWHWSLGNNDGGVSGLPIVGPDALYVPLQCPPPSPQAPQGVCDGAVVALGLKTGVPLWSAGTGATVALMTGASTIYAIEIPTSGSTRSELLAIGE